jgi:integrase
MSFNRQSLPTSVYQRQDARKVSLSIISPKSLGMRQVGFRAIRHGVASGLFDSGTSIVVIQDQMRHSDVRVPLGIYGYVVGNAQRKAVDVLSRIVTRESNKKAKVP